MKTKTKALALFLSAVLLVVTTVFTTMAYLTSKTDVVKNTFTYGKVEITLDEADVDGSKTNSKTTIGGVVRDEANAYHLLPGGTYTKDPQVHIKSDSEDCYVRMLVTVTGYNKLATAFPKEADSVYWVGDVFLLQNLVDWNTAWQYEGATSNGTTAVYEFRYTDKYVDVSALKVNETYEGYSDLPALFTEITIPGTMTNDQIEALNGVGIEVVAHAIQELNFEDADDAWTNFAVQTGTN